MPVSTGTYALVLEAHSHEVIVIGRLGEMTVVPGYYIYVGSAFGSGGLKARLSHHCRISSKPHWHMDYLRKVCNIRKIWFTGDDEARESCWVAIFSGMSGVMQPLSGFGATDSKHETHLFRVSEFPVIEYFIEALNNRITDHAPVLECDCSDIGICL